MKRNEILSAIQKKQPKIHCLTNPVTMNDVANILLAAGGSAVMAQDEQEAAEITTFCHGTLLNTGVPNEAKIKACILAGKRANQLGHPVILDPVGAGGSSFRQRELQKLLEHPRWCREQSAYGFTGSAFTCPQSCTALSLHILHHRQDRYYIRWCTDSSSEWRRFPSLPDHRRRMHALCPLCTVQLQRSHCF